ncbi:MAG TPA: M14 metallopeptidase family protein [Bryobacteraceae bacterium]|nr:M14 metallopeptidase family protein [Bryobacteraceae bacterium]
MRAALRCFAPLLAALCQAAVPTPREHFGYTPGDDYKLADYGEIISYFQKLARSSDRILLAEFGKTSMGKPMYMAYISSPENLKKLDQYRSISRRLALGEPDEAEARKLAEQGRAIVWIDSGLHASEVAPAQHSPELAYRMLTDDGEETDTIRRQVILLQIPVINPDGLDMISHWYRGNLGTRYEAAPLPWLYQKYAGHDNNRDWFMMNLAETRAVSRLLFREWFPQIVYNQHQSPPFPARIFVPPYAEPLNPNIPAAVMEGINAIGMAMKERFARENKPGVLSYHGYDGWWNGGLRSVPAFHNMHGILTETALNSYGTPRTYDPSEFPARFTNGISTREPSMFYERPWMGGKWGAREAIDYMLTADFAILNIAAGRRTDYLLKSYQMARQAMEAGRKGKPYAYVVPAAQWDRPTAVELLDRLAQGGVEVKRARAAFQAGGKSYPAGTHVVAASQPFRAYLVDLLEPQVYPALGVGANGRPKRPYDIAGWTLPMDMGVQVDRIADRFEADLEPAGPELKSEGQVRGEGSIVLLDHRENAGFFGVNFFLGRNEKVRIASTGEIILDSPYLENRERVENFARQFGITVQLQEQAPGRMLYELKQPRVALYQPWIANADQGWTEWLLDHYGLAHTLIHNDDFRKGDLRRRFDTLILASQTAVSILHGFRDGEYSAERAGRRLIAAQRPEYVGGIGIEGLAHLDRFVRDGGTLIALDSATELPIEYFALPVKNVARGEGESSFYSPGSILRVNVDTSHPLAFGMPKNAFVFSSGGEAFEITLAPEHNRGEREIHGVVSFAAKNLLASGWVSGERHALGKQALVESRYGKGRVVLFGFRPQFRGQSYGAFKLLLNAIYLGSAQPLQ